MKSIIMKFIISSFGFFLFSSTFAAVPAVSPGSCVKERNSDHPFMLILDKGVDLPQAVANCMSFADIQGATISGVGLVKNVDLAYFDTDKDIYKSKKFDGEYELLDLDGNIGMLNGQPKSHIHVVLGDKKFHTIGGHLIDATVALKSELLVTPVGILQRKYIAGTPVSTIQTE